MSRRIASLLAMPALAVILAACTQSNGADAPQARPAERRPVVVEVVQFEPRTPARTFVGTVRPRVESDLGFRVAGKIAERLVQQGESVRAGQPLMRLDATDFDLSRRQAEAEVRAASVNLEQAVANERRTVELRRNGWTTDAVLERAVATTAEARARLDRAQRALDLATNQNSYAVLLADADGVVTATMVEPGQVVAAGAPVVRLARAGDREAVVAVPEMLLERVRNGTASVAFWSHPERTFPARLRELAAAADPATRTFQARFAIDGADDMAVIGATATVTVLERSNTDVARLPVSALFNQGQGPALWVVDATSGGLTLTPVTVAGYEGSDVLVTGGIGNGAKVVTLGVHKLDAGQRVRIVDTRS